ncbi:MAG: peptide-methionine (R)-S-oxide reductase MsrB [Saprospiraceae bacterium]|nr:peptide-methionine (R)-S-oxide reductase MsrB [Saprospiraceae bacterium]
MICFCHISCKSPRQNKETSITPRIETVPASKDFIVNKRGDNIELVTKTEEEWKKTLSAEEFYVIRNKGTERAFSGDLWDNKQEGLYTCAACGQVLFLSSAKYDSGTGWPSFFRPDDELMIKKETDHKIGYPRTEVMCARCGGHLGHVFDDGPPPTGLRYCLNSVSLNFVKSDN